MPITCSWTELRPVGDVNKVWHLLLASKNLNYIIAGTNQRLYRSSNGGVDWIETQPAGDVNKDWAKGDISYNGRYVVVSAGAYLYLSSDYGYSWTSYTEPLTQGWDYPSISDDGDCVGAWRIPNSSAPKRLLRISTDGGVNFSTCGHNSWSSTWQSLYFKIFGNGEIILKDGGHHSSDSPIRGCSFDLGGSWSDATSKFPTDSDGKVMGVSDGNADSTAFIFGTLGVAGYYDAHIYTKHDTFLGSNAVDRGAATGHSSGVSFRGVGISDSGGSAFTCEYKGPTHGYVRYTNDLTAAYSAGYTDITPPGAITEKFSGLQCDSAGERAIVCEVDGRVWKGETSIWIPFKPRIMWFT